MKTVIYRKSDLSIVGQVNGTLEDTLNLNVIPNFGGTAEDYGSIETDKENFHLETVNSVVTVVEDTVATAVQAPSLQAQIDGINKYLLSL